MARMHIANVEASLKSPVNAVRGMADCRCMPVLSHCHNAAGARGWGVRRAAT